MCTRLKTHRDWQFKPNHINKPSNSRKIDINIDTDMVSMTFMSSDFEVLQYLKFFLIRFNTDISYICPSIMRVMAHQ